MRGFLLVTVLLGALWGFDVLAFDGYYGAAAWDQAQYQSQKFSDEMKEWWVRFGRH